MSWISSATAARLRCGALRSNEQATCSNSRPGDPGEGHVVIRPFPGDEDRDLVLLGAVERPFVDGGQPLHHVDGVLGSVVGDSLDQGHQGSFGAGYGTRHDRPGSALLKERRRPLRPAPSPGADGRNLGDSSSNRKPAGHAVHRICETNRDFWESTALLSGLWLGKPRLERGDRAASFSFSSRAFAAISRTASNSSRVTTSMPAIIAFELAFGESLRLPPGAVGQARGVRHQAGEIVEKSAAGLRHEKAPGSRRRRLEPRLERLCGARPGAAQDRSPAVRRGRRPRPTLCAAGLLASIRDSSWRKPHAHPSRRPESRRPSAALRAVPAARIGRPRSRPAGARRGSGADRGGRALPFRPLGDRRLAAAARPDGARARGGRNVWRRSARA